MKFLETMNGDIINVDEIVRIFWSSREGKKYGSEKMITHLYSNVNLKNGETLDLIEIPNLFDDENGKTINFDSDHLISLHRHVAWKIAQVEDGDCLGNEELETCSWDDFMKEYNQNSKKFVL